jgi:hypothetical protein
VRTFLYRVFVLILVALAGVALLSFLLNPFLRGRIEREMNSTMKGYRVSLEHANLSILNGTLVFRNLNIIQISHPAAPIIHLPVLRLGIRWFDLLGGHIVADCLITEPDILMNFIQLSAATSGEIYILPPGWQDAVRHVHPFTIKTFRVTDARVTYYDARPSRTLKLEHAYFTAQDIRNFGSPLNRYPSPITAELVVFKTGHATIQGRADLLAQPIPNLLINYRLDRVPLAALDPAVNRFNLTLTNGYLDSDGIVEYSPSIERVEIHRVLIDRLNIEYLHNATTAKVEASHLKAGRMAMQHATSDPKLLLKLDQGQIKDGFIAYRDESGSPTYRLYVASINLRVSDFSNRSDQHISRLKMEGLFMGSGQVNLTGDFKPRHRGPDFDLNFTLLDTQLPSLNDVLRRYGRFEVQSGQFSVYAQGTVHDGGINGYVKPLFTNLQLRNSTTGQKQSVFHDAYQLAVKGATKLLRNPSTKAVATKIDLSGKVEDPNISTIGAVARLATNAFIIGIAPGFDR